MVALVLWLAVAVVAAPFGGVDDQGSTGGPANAISGVVVDPTGAVLPGAHIELKSASANQNQSTISDAVGQFRFERVAQGRYDVVVTFEGFQPTTVRVSVGARASSSIRIMLPLARITQEVTVRNSAAELKTDTASNLDASSVDANAIENLPVFNQDVLATMSRFLDSSAIGTNGATLVVNGVEVNGLNVSASAIQQIKINQDPYSAEYPRPGRGRIEVVLKPGSMEYHGTANFIFRDSRLDERNAFAAGKPPEQRRIFEGFLSGPVRHSDKTSFMLSLKDNVDDAQSIVFAQTLAGQLQQNVASPYRNVLAAATLNHQRGDSTTMSLTLSYQDHDRA
jgi:Carboxypeptidase regulatory-like domain